MPRCVRCDAVIPAGGSGRPCPCCGRSFRRPVSLRLSRRRFLQGSVAAAWLALAGLTHQACDSSGPSGQADGTPASSGGTGEAATPTPSTGPLETLSNVQVSHDAFTMHAEPSLAANPVDPENLVAVSIVRGEDGVHSLATYASFDGGASWQSNGALPESLGGRDPTVSFNAAGQGFVCGNTSLVSVWRTDDGGRSFSGPVAVTQGEKVDHPALAADRSTGPSSGNLYVVWSVEDNTRLGFARSTDAGRSFEPSRIIAEAGGRITAAPTIAAGRDGLVCVTYGTWESEGATPGSGRRPETIAPIMVVCSTDYGETFGSPIELGLGAMEMWLPGDASGLGLPAVTAAWDHHAAYVAFVSRQPEANSSNIVVSASYDRGRTWSAAAPVAREQDGVYYFQPQVAVDGDGRLAVSAFMLEDGLVHVVLFVSEPRSLRFSRSVTVTLQPFDPAVGSEPGGAKHGAWWIGDYQGLATTPGAYHPLWNDTRTGRLELFTATVQRQ